jgi:hypothetical protein
VKEITKANKAKAVAIVCVAFKDIDAVTSVIKYDSKKEERVKVLFDFCVSVSMEKEGAFLTSDEMGVALLFKSWKKLSLASSVSNYFKLVHYGISWERAPSVIIRDHHVQKRRIKEKHLYFWLLGFDNSVKDLQRMIQIRDFCFAYAKELQLPIAAETSNQGALKMYLRYGFKIYDEWKPREDKPTLYFIIRDWRD